MTKITLRRSNNIAEEEEDVRDPPVPSWSRREEKKGLLLPRVVCGNGN